MKREGTARVLKIIGLFAAAAAILLVLRFLLNVNAGGRDDLIITQVAAMDPGDGQTFEPQPEAKGWR